MFHIQEHPLPKIRPLVWIWFVLIAFALTLFHFTGWSIVPFLMQFITGVIAAIVAPIWMVDFALAWKGRRTGGVFIASMAIGIVISVSLFFGIFKGVVERMRPDLLSAVVLANGQGEGEDWRLVVAIGDRMLLTKIRGGVAFQEYKYANVDEIEIISSTRFGAPWAPAPNRKDAFK
jgi:hypothetical protein